MTLNNLKEDFSISIDHLIKPLGQTGASNNFKNGVICIYCKILGHHQQECNTTNHANKPLPQPYPMPATTMMVSVHFIKKSIMKSLIMQMSNDIF
jgi:hypothetical protein